MDEWMGGYMGYMDMDMDMVWIGIHMDMDIIDIEWYIYIYCPAFMIVEKVVLYICIFGHHGYSTNIHYWSELGTLRTS